MSTFLTSLPDQIGVEPNEKEKEALQHLRNVVRLLDRENEQFRKDCEEKLAFQMKQQDRITEENERLRMKVAEMSRPKVSVLLAIEERQALLAQQVDIYTAKLEVNYRCAEEIEKSIEDVTNKTANILSKTQSKTTVVECTGAELEAAGYKMKTEGRHTVFIGPNGEKYNSKNEVCRAMSYVPESKLKKKLARLEVRVHNILTKFNESLSVNKELRAEIEHLRKERMSFDSIASKLQAALIQKKAEIATAIETTNVALETRDEANRKISFYKAEIMKNQQEFDSEWRRLDDAMESEEKRRKLVKARMDEEAKKAKNTEEDAAQKAHMHALTIKYEASKADIERFEEAFRKLQEATGLKDIDELIKTFLEAEEHNFKLFSFLNELNMEEERLVAEVVKLRAELAELQQEPDLISNQDLRRKFETQLAHIHAKAEHFGEMRLDEEAKVEDMLKITRRMFHELGCSKYIDPKDNFICDGNDPIISDATMLHILSMIEQRATELILNLIKKKSLEVDDQPEGQGIKLLNTCPLGIGPANPVGSSTLKVQAPKIETEDKSGDEESEDDHENEDSRPMTQVHIVCKSLFFAYREFQLLEIWQDELRNKIRKKMAASQNPKLRPDRKPIRPR